MSAPAVEAVELIGPKGYTHNWVYHGPGPGTRGRTSRLVTRTVRGAKTQPGNASQIADKATKSLRGGKASDYQHMAAARLHAAAARAEKGESARKAHHIAAAAMHRGIARRNVGRQTSGEGPLRSAPARRGKVQVKHEGPGTHGVFVNGKRVGGVVSVGGGGHTARRGGHPGSQATTHGVLTERG